MWGAVLGDIVGSRFEFQRPPQKSKDFVLLHEACDYTDDTVCTAACADILVNGLDAAKTMQAWCRRHPNRGYGGMFAGWIESDDPGPYGSYGNGAAMRISPVAYFHRDGTLAEALADADRITAITHDHEEGMRAARATTRAIWLACRGEGPGGIRKAVEAEDGYRLDESVDVIRGHAVFDETSPVSVPQAIVCALESTDWEDAVRNAVSLGADTDTQAAIAGAIAEALHGLPDGPVDWARNGPLREAGDITEVMAALYG